MYKVSGMNDELMAEINSMVDAKGHAAVSERCDFIAKNNCKLKFIGFPVAARTGIAAFEENLDLLDPRLPKIIDYMLWNHFLNMKLERTWKLSQKTLC